MKNSLLSKNAQCKAIASSFLALALAIAAPIGAFSQGVGINTTTPDPSAALDIKTTNKGLLIPRVTLPSKSDNIIIQNPATGLLVFHTTKNQTGNPGFYFNNGTPASPNWLSIATLNLPYYQAASLNDDVIRIDNYSQGFDAVAVKAFSVGNGTALYGISDANGLAIRAQGGVRISGSGQNPGLGKVLTSDADGNAKWEGAVAFSAAGIKGNGGEVIASLESYTVPFLENYDISNSYSTFDQNPASKFTVPVNGIYHFDALITWQQPKRVELNLKFIREGVTTFIANKTVYPDNTIDLNIDAKLNAGDQVFIEVKYLDPGHLTLFQSGAQSYFNGHLVVRQ